MPTKIDWCDEVWNPVTGCSKVSEGCRNCYAEGIATRFWGERKFADVRCHEDRLDIPTHWKKPRTVFVDSMSDLFHPSVPFDFILRVWMIMAEAKDRHTFVILTKRPERMQLFITEWLPGAWGLATMSLRLLEKPLPNVVLGVSVEDQPAAHLRIPYLLQTPAAYRVVSVEPMLEEIDLSPALNGYPVQNEYHEWIQTMPALDGVICGCESGPHARPFDPDWARSIRDQCVRANVPFFLKQMPVDGRIVHMPALDGVVWDRVPWGK